MRIEGFQLRLLTIEGRDRFDELCGCHLGEPTKHVSVWKVWELIS